MFPSRSDLRREDGVALIFALFATLILAGLAVVLVSRSVAQSRATGHEQRNEAAIHVAEAGLDDLIEVLNVTWETLSSYDSDGDDVPDTTHVYPFPTDPLDPAYPTEAEERQWAIDVARNTCDLVEIPGVGLTCGIRPQVGGVEGNIMYGVGFVNMGTATEQVRVVKIRIAKSSFQMAKAILTNGDVDPLNSKICGTHADVHSNGDLDVQSNADLISCADPDGKITATGQIGITGSPPVSPKVYKECTATYTHEKCSQENVGYTEFVPSIDARELYDEWVDDVKAKEGEAGDANPDTATDNAVIWSNLCPNGTARRPYTATGTIVPPCHSTAAILWPVGAPPSVTHNGWSFGPQGWSAGGGNNASALQDGIYYVFEKNAQISGNIGRDAKISVLMDAVGDIEEFERPPAIGLSDRTCNKSGKDDGNLTVNAVTGGGLQAYSDFLESSLFLTDRDFTTSGNLSAIEIHGVISAHEQVSMGGNPTITGGVIAEDACNSNQSPVNENVFTGSVKLDHKVIDDTALRGVVQITAWNELRP